MDPPAPSRSQRSPDGEAAQESSLSEVERLAATKPLLRDLHLWLLTRKLQRLFVHLGDGPMQRTRAKDQLEARNILDRWLLSFQLDRPDGGMNPELPIFPRQLRGAECANRKLTDECLEKGFSACRRNAERIAQALINAVELFEAEIERRVAHDDASACVVAFWERRLSGRPAEGQLRVGDQYESPCCPRLWFLWQNFGLYATARMMLRYETLGTGSLQWGDPEVLAARGGCGSVREADFQLPLASAQVVVDAVTEQLDKLPNIRVAIFDHITSTTACVMPVKQLTALCRSRGVKVIIDGAHAIGQIQDLSIEDIGADCYIGNLNKWHFLPKSVALMWIGEDLTDCVKPGTVSWLVNDSEFPVRYCYLGTRDTSSFYVIADSVRFIEDVCGGLDNVHSYCTQLADEATLYLSNCWGTSRLPLPDSMQAPYMRLIKLPEHLQQPEMKELMREFRFGSRLWNFLAYQLKMDLLILDIQGTLYVRVSAAIIVSMDDVRKLGDTMMSLSVADFISIVE